MKNLVLMPCVLFVLAACGNGVACDDQKVLVKLDNRFLQTDSIVTIFHDSATGNVKCHAKIVGALAYDGLDYSVMKTKSGELVVDSAMTGRIM